MKFKKINLPYSLDYLEPIIDKETVNIHYNKHHGAYELKINEFIKGTELENYSSIKELMMDYENIKEEYKKDVRNNGGGLINHDFYWKQFTNDYKIDINKIINAFGSLTSFKEEMIFKGLSIFGSGWVWLVDDNGYKIITTPNQENPWMKKIDKIIIGIDVWEHSYYLKYKNNRKEYLVNILNYLLDKKY